MSSTDGCAIFRWIIGAGLDQKKNQNKKNGKNLSVLLRYNSKLIVPSAGTDLQVYVVLSINGYSSSFCKIFFRHHRER